MTARPLGALLAILVVGAPPAPAAEPDPTPGPAAAAAGSVAPDPSEIDPAEPDFTLITLPTTLRLPCGKLASRITHRFDRPLGDGDLGDLAGDLFGLDGGAVVGLELRVGVTKRVQLGVYRTSNRTLDLFGSASLLHEGPAPVALSLSAGVEGRDNFSEEHSPRLGLVVSRRLGSRGALYAVPSWVGNTRPGDGPGDDSTFVLGLGTRLGLGAGVALLAEFNPRLTGFEPAGSEDHLAFGLEKRVGGHAFQLNVSNTLGTTPAQVARGRSPLEGWYLGFNITRRFY